MEKFIPVVVIKELSETDKILTALKKSGINCAEITFRTACAAEAIAYAVRNAVPGEIILIAGKGHENYEIRKDGKHPFCEKDEVMKALKERESLTGGSSDVC